MSDGTPVRVRMAPSPTGYFHIGTARTALFNWLYAKKQKGVFIVRIEDTDRERSRPEYEKDITCGLEWLGLHSDEFYRQSERTAIYKKYLERLLDAGSAFYCPHSPAEPEVEFGLHRCQARDKRLGNGIIRFRNDSAGSITIRDVIRGDISFDSHLLGDFSLAKNLDEPLYNFAVVVDDYEMRISHVIRGEDHISNTPKQILTQRALAMPEPAWAHMPLLLGTDRSKLSKRHGALPISDYRAKGYLADALINFIALLGWHPSAKESGKSEQEIFSKTELINAFELERIQKGGAIAALEKLDWLNREYIKKLTPQEFWHYASPFVSKSTRRDVSEKTLQKIVEVSRMRISIFSELGDVIDTLFNPPAYQKDLLLWRGKLGQEKVREVIDKIIIIVSGMKEDNFTKEKLEAVLAPLAEKEGKGSVLWPLRAALSGSEASPGPYELASLLGKKISLARLTRARELLAK